MKFSLAYVKQNPVMFGIIALVFGLLFWVYLNKGQSSVTYADAGPTDAEVQAQAQIAAMQIQQAGQAQQIGGQVAIANLNAQSELALANLGAQVSLADLAASERLGMAQLESYENQYMAQLQNNFDIVQSNNQFTVDYAKVAYDAAAETVRVNAALQAQLSSDQKQAYIASAMFNAVGDVKPVDRDNAFALAVAGVTGAPVSYRDRTSGSFSTTGEAAPMNQTNGGGGLLGFFRG